MTLEALFARQQQARTFLLLCGAGLIAGALLHVSRPLHRKNRALGDAWDALSVIALFALIAAAMLRSQSGLRLYAALGLTVGLTLYFFGLRQVFAWLGRLLFQRKKAANQAGDSQGNGE